MLMKQKRTSTANAPNCSFELPRVSLRKTANKKALATAKAANMGRQSRNLIAHGASLSLNFRPKKTKAKKEVAMESLKTESTAI
jgi:hypothetical protein